MACHYVCALALWQHFLQFYWRWSSLKLVIFTILHALIYLILQQSYHVLKNKNNLRYHSSLWLWRAFSLKRVLTNVHTFQILKHDPVGVDWLVQSVKHLKGMVMKSMGRLCWDVTGNLVKNQNIPQCDYNLPASPPSLPTLVPLISPGTPCCSPPWNGNLHRVNHAHWPNMPIDRHWLQQPEMRGRLPKISFVAYLEVS